MLHQFASPYPRTHSFLLCPQSSKAVVTPQWLRDSVEAGKPLPCEDYVAVGDLHDTTVQNCPDCERGHCTCIASSNSPSSTRSIISSDSPSIPSSSMVPYHVSPSSGKEQYAEQSHLLPPDPPLKTNMKKLDHTSRYACQRASPLVCPNQDLVRELSIIRQSRMLEGEDRSALSYERAASAIKGAFLLHSS